MITPDFNWNHKSIRARFHTGHGEELVEMSPKEIITNPSRINYEAITSAMCKVMQELVALEEQRQASINALMNKTPAPKSDQQEMPL